MSIITLTTDWNLDDYYSASVKGRILSICPDATVVTITNQVPPFNTALAAFQLKHAYKHFPDKTVHIIAVNSESAENRPYIALKADGQFFISADNGVFGLLLEQEPDEVISLGNHSDTFPELTVFAETACKIVRNGSLADLGTEYTQMYKQVPLLPAIEESVINGSVIYIDSYKNAITNIGLELFQQIGKGRSFEIFVQSNHYKINRLNKKYSDSSMGEMLALFNSVGLLEIAINRGNASDLLNLALNSSIRVKFKE
jgi:hypothetical protein